MTKKLRMYLETDFTYNIKEILEFIKKISYYICVKYKKAKKNVFL